MYGDGNFYWNTGEITPPRSYNYYHTYLQGTSDLTYNPVVLLIERKTDEPPPSSNMVVPTGTISIPTGSSPADFINFPTGTHPAMIDVVKTCQRVALEHSHYLEDGSWSAFILANYPEVEGVLLFFYDQNADPELFENTTETYGPRYGARDLPDGSTRENASIYGTGIYRKVLRYDINSNHLGIDDPSDGKEELRIFHYLLSTNDIETVTTPSSYMVILAGKDSTGCSSANYDEDHDFVSNYVDPGNLTISNGSETYFFIDADTIQIKHGDPKDPNSLKVTKICQCDNGKYRVYFNLTFCNISPILTEGASIFINDPHKKFRCYQSLGNEPGFDLQSGGAVQDWDACTEANNKCSTYNFCNGCDAKYCVGGYRILLNDHTRLAGGDCVSFGFSAETDAAGLDLLWQEGALNACVNFHETQCELVCSYSEKLDTTNVNDSTYVEIWNDRNVACVEACPSCWCIPWPWVIAAAVLVAFAVILFRRKKKITP